MRTRFIKIVTITINDIQHQEADKKVNKEIRKISSGGGKIVTITSVSSGHFILYTVIYEADAEIIDDGHTE